MKYFQIDAHWSLVRQKNGVQSVQTFHVDDKFIGTTVQQVYAKLSSHGITKKVISLACSMAKDAYAGDMIVIIRDSNDKPWRTECVEYDYFEKVD